MKSHTALQALLALATITTAIQVDPDATPELAVRQVSSSSSACTGDRAHCDSQYPTPDTSRDPPSTTHTPGSRQAPTSDGQTHPHTSSQAQYSQISYPLGTGATSAAPGPTAPAGAAGGSGGAAMPKSSGTSSASASGSTPGSAGAGAALREGGAAALKTAGAIAAWGTIVGVMAL